MVVRWGVIGAGGFASKRPLPALRNAAGCKLQALMDVDRAKDLAHEFGAVSYYDNVDELLADDQVDAVYIITPVFLHHQQVLQAAKRGKHVLCEKPLALNSSEAAEMVGACRDNKVKFMPAFMLRFHSSHLRVKELIDNGTLGQIILARAQLHLWYPDVPGAWRQNPRLGGGGALMDLGPHCLDLLCFLLGDVVSVTAMVDTIAFDYQVEDTAAAVLKFASGAAGMLDVSFAVGNRENFLEVYGTKGTLLGKRTIGPFKNPQMRLLSEEGETDLTIPYSDTYQAEFEHFSDCIINDREPKVTGEDGVKNMQLIEAIYQSARSGRLIDII